MTAAIAHEPLRYWFDDFFDSCRYIPEFNQVYGDRYERHPSCYFVLFGPAPLEHGYEYDFLEQRGFVRSGQMCDWTDVLSQSDVS